MLRVISDEDRHQLGWLLVPFGQPGSGRIRYGAAMYFNRAGLLSDAALEVFRVVSPNDAEDPRRLLTERGLGWELPDEADLRALVAPDHAIRTLVDAAGTYLRTLPGPGIAAVLAGLARWRRGPVTVAGALANPVVDTNLPGALAALRLTHPALANAIASAWPHLAWVSYDAYPADLIGPDFPRAHAFASLIDADAAIPAVDFDIGLFLIAPHVLYRDHCHAAPELYAPLTGPHGWRFGPDRPLILKPAHQPVWNPSYLPHLTKVGAVPFLCFYAWTRDVTAPAQVVPASDWSDLEAMRLP